MPTCPNCGRPVEERDAVCGTCGTALPTHEGPADARATQGASDAAAPGGSPDDGAEDSGPGLDRRTLLKLGGAGLVGVGAAGGAWYMFLRGSADSAWPTPFGGPGNRRFATAGTGPRSRPSVDVRATVIDEEFRAMSALISQGVAWNANLRRVSLTDGSVRPGIQPPAIPLAVTDNGVVASVGNNNRRTLAFYDTDLARQWSVKVPGTRTPVLGDGVLFVAATEEPYRAWAIDLADGTIRWEVPFDRDLTGIAVEDGTVYATTSTTQGLALAAIDGASGTRRRLWEYTGRDAESMTPGIPVVADGRVVVSRLEAMGGEPPPPSMFAVDASDGTTLWTENSVQAGFPIVTDSAVIRSGRAYSPSDGRQLWEVSQAVRDSLEGMVTGSMATSETLFFGTVDSRLGSRAGFALYAIDTSDGSERWRLPFEPTTYRLRVVGDRLVVGMYNGEVYVLQ